MTDPARPHAPPTIDMTLEGEVLAPPSRWTVLRQFWQGLPRGALPALLFGLMAVLAGVVLLFGLALLLLPAIAILGVGALLARAVLPRRPA